LNVLYNYFGAGCSVCSDDVNVSFVYQELAARLEKGSIYEGKIVEIRYVLVS